jgi:hypothetical protein
VHKVITFAVDAALALGACGDDDTTTTQAPSTAQAPSTTQELSTDSTNEPAATPTTTSAESPCGVTLAQVQALLPATSGVTENSTPDPRRCNFTWDDGGPRGIDVAIAPGGRSSFEVPPGYEPLDGFGDEAFAAFAEGHASAFAFVGDDLYVAEVVADGADADLRDLCLQLLALALG